jgi:DNA replication protein DnaC
MTNASVCKFSASRRKGDVYELHLLALQCLRMLVEPKIVHVLHEYRPVLPADDVMVESIDRVDCYQAKHAHDPHALLTFQDLVATTDLQLNIRRLKVAWDQLRLYGKEVYLHIYTNRAADEELAKLLADDRILPAVIEDSMQKQRRARLKAVAEIAEENEFKQFLRSLRFDLRQHSLDQLREHIQQHWIQHRLGLDPKEAYQRLMFNVEKWGLESQSRPIPRQEVLQALQIDSGTLPRVFHVDPRTYVAHPAFKRQLDEVLASAQTGHIAIVGPPGSGKSTFLTRYIHRLEQQQHQAVIRYYCFTQVHDPLFLRRVTVTEFLKSMIEQLQQQFGHLLPEGGRYDYSPERLQQLISFLGQHFIAQDRKLVMVVDGLDHAYRADLEATKKLLTILPEHLPHGVVCLIGAQGTQYLPTPIQRECREQRYHMLPLFDLHQTFRYLRHYP